MFGAPQAAALGAVLVLYFGLAGALSFVLPLAAILGALISIALVVAVAGREGGTVVLVLAGLAIGSLAGAATSLAISLSPNPFAITEIVFWLLGSLEDRRWRMCFYPLPSSSSPARCCSGPGRPCARSRSARRRRRASA